MDPTLYSVIGLTPEASEKEIYRAVKNTARSVKESDAPKSEKKNLIKYIKLARDTLMEPGSREEYDRTIGIGTINRGQDYDPEHVMDTRHDPSPITLGDMIGSLGSIEPIGSMGPIGSISSMVPFGSSRGTSTGITDPIGSMLSGHMDLLQSIIPEGFGDVGTHGNNMQSGTFHFMEYTKVRNPGGGFDEFGVTREGDSNQDRVTEKRFHKKG